MKLKELKIGDKFTVPCLTCMHTLLSNEEGQHESDFSKLPIDCSMDGKIWIDSNAEVCAVNGSELNLNQKNQDEIKVSDLEVGDEFEISGFNCKHVLLSKKEDVNFPGHLIASCSFSVAADGKTYIDKNRMVKRTKRVNNQMNLFDLEEGDEFEFADDNDDNYVYTIKEKELIRKVVVQEKDGYETAYVDDAGEILVIKTKKNSLRLRDLWIGTVFCFDNTDCCTGNVVLVKFLEGNDVECLILNNMSYAIFDGDEIVKIVKVP